jgi:hypothetical protein
MAAAIVGMKEMIKEQHTKGATPPKVVHVSAEPEESLEGEGRLIRAHAASGGECIHRVEEGAFRDLLDTTPRLLTHTLLHTHHAERGGCIHGGKEIRVTRHP